MNIGIDKISFYVPNLFIHMDDLAEARNEDPNKFKIGLGQEKMSVCPITQDTISLAANAADIILDEKDKNEIDLVILATESGLDYSKAGATTLHNLLGINPYARAIEIKQACYAGTAALFLAQSHIALNPGKKALVVTSDISRYGLNSSGEVTQGAGAVAMLVSQNPRIAKFNQDNVSYTDDTYDFWRPNYSDYAFVDGHYSNQEYRRVFNITSTRYMEKYNTTLEDFDAFAFHIPYTKMGTKILDSFIERNHPLAQKFQKSILYNKNVGNIYTGSLYLHLISLLDNLDLESDSKIAFYSYGSGTVGEFFSMNLCENYKDHLFTSQHKSMLTNRKKLTIKEYEREFLKSLVTDGTHQILPIDSARFQLKEIKNHQRIYLDKKSKPNNKKLIHHE